MKPSTLTEVDVDKLEGEPYDVDEVVLPAELLEGNGVDVLVEDERKRNGEVEDDEALSTELVRENLDGVRDDQRCVGDAKNNKVRPSNCNEACGRTHRQR